MKVKLLRLPDDFDWSVAYDTALFTEGKETAKLPTNDWMIRMLKARHSPIRLLEFLFEITDIPYWVSVHLVRHIHAVPFVQSQRNDRQNKYDRNKAPQDAPVNMRWHMNAEELITIANKRLCGKASKETREVVQMMCDEVIKVCPEFKDELVPMCERNGGVCYEMRSCGKARR